ncbi:MAG TPA: rRNA maturation RNase YbeY [Thermoanaerobaculia bacterium]
MQAKVAGAPPAPHVRRTLGRTARLTRARAGEVSVLFCADARMRSLNRRYRGKDKTTDVLAFPAGPGSPGGVEGFLGDIVISVPYAAREARRREDTRSREIDRLLVHGFLHLMGYDHETDEGQMDALEGRVRRRLGLASAASAATRTRAAAAARSRR